MPTIIDEQGLADCNPCLTGNHAGCRKRWQTGMRSKAVQHTCACSEADHRRGRQEALGSVHKVHVDDANLPEVSDRAKCVTRIPKHLAKSPQDKRGFPVPHVSEWSDESMQTNLERGSRRFAKTVVGPSQFEITVMAPEGEQGKGSPKLASLQPIRQRDCVLNRRCQVCGKPIDVKSVVVFVGGEYADAPVKGSDETRTVLAFREPPLHKRCAVFALFACPGINTGQAVVVECRDYKVLPFSKRLLSNEPDDDGIYPVETAWEWLPADAGYLEYVLAVPADDARVHVNLVTYREKNAGMVK
jgi:hypothetical protein